MTELWESLQPREALSEEEVSELDPIQKFVATHDLSLIITEFGQNQRLRSTELNGYFRHFFDFRMVRKFSFALAENFGIEGLSLLLPSDSISRILRNQGRLRTFPKCFNNEFSQFEFTGSIDGLLDSVLNDFPNYQAEMSSLIGYSDLMNVIRRNQYSSPFAKRPISSLFNLIPGTPRPKFILLKEKVYDDFNYLIDAINCKIDTGCFYRLEATIHVQMPQELDLNDFQNFINCWEETLSGYCEAFAIECGSFYEPNQFPGCFKTLLTLLQTNLDQLILILERNNLRQDPNSTYWLRNTASFLESLLLYMINGNERSLSHNLITTLSVKHSIQEYKFPFIPPGLFNSANGLLYVGLLPRNTQLCLNDNMAGFKQCNIERLQYSYVESLLENSDRETDHKALQLYRAFIDLLIIDYGNLVKNASSKIPEAIKERVMRQNDWLLLEILNSNQELFESKTTTVDDFLRHLLSLDFSDPLQSSFNAKYLSGKLIERVKLNLKNRNLGQALRDHWEAQLRGLKVIPEINGKGWTGKLILFAEPTVADSILGMTTGINKKFTLLQDNLQTYKPNQRETWLAEFYEEYQSNRRTLEIWKKYTNARFIWGHRSNYSDEDLHVILLSLILSALQPVRGIRREFGKLKGRQTYFIVVAISILNRNQRIQLNNAEDSKKCKAQATSYGVSSTLLDCAIEHLSWDNLVRYQDSEAYLQIIEKVIYESFQAGGRI